MIFSSGRKAEEEDEREKIMKAQHKRIIYYER